MTNEERLRAIAATEESILHHKRDVLAQLEADVPLWRVSRMIGSESCELCERFFDHDGDECAACPLFQFGSGCNTDGSPWSKLADAVRCSCEEDREFAIAASRHMIVTIEAVRAMLTLTATSEEIAG
jgi:hypothetical protein